MFTRKKLLTVISFSLLFLLNFQSVFALSDIAGNKNQTAIQYLYDNKVISGYADGTFKPEKSVSRSELLKILVNGKVVGQDLSEYKNCFKDVGTEWFAQYVCYAKEKNWISGYSDGTFRPAKEVNKAEALKMLVNTQEYEIPELVDEMLFDDVDNNGWYAPFVKVAKEKGLLENNNGNYGVADFMTR